MINYTTNQLINVSIPANSSSPVALFDTALSAEELAIRNSGRQVICNRYVKSLRAYVDINSIPPVAIPKFDELESNFERNLKIREVEWKGARKLLKLLYRNGAGDWLERGALSLTNRNPLPYFDANLLDFYSEGLAAELGESDQLGVSIENVEFGLLTEDDAVKIYGNLVTEYFIEEIDVAQMRPKLMFFGQQNANQTLTNNAENILTFNSISINEGAGFNGSNGYIIPIGFSGLYRLSAFTDVRSTAGTPTGSSWVGRFLINNQILRNMNRGSSSFTLIQQGWSIEGIQLSAGDLIQARIFSNIAGSTAIRTDISEAPTYLKIELLT